MLNKAPNIQLNVFTFILPTIITHQNKPRRNFHFHMDIGHHRISRVYPNEKLNEFKENDEIGKERETRQQQQK